MMSASTLPPTPDVPLPAVTSTTCASPCCISTAARSAPTPPVPPRRAVVTPPPRDPEPIAQYVRNIEQDNEERLECKICLDAPRAVRFQKCGHCCVCTDCYNDLLQLPPEHRKCPLCNVHIGDAHSLLQTQAALQTFMASQTRGTNRQQRRAAEQRKDKDRRNFEQVFRALDQMGCVAEVRTRVKESFEAVTWMRGEQQSMRATPEHVWQVQKLWVPDGMVSVGLDRNPRRMAIMSEETFFCSWKNSTATTRSSTSCCVQRRRRRRTGFGESTRRTCG